MLIPDNEVNDEMLEFRRQYRNKALKAVDDIRKEILRSRDVPKGHRLFWAKLRLKS